MSSGLFLEPVYVKSKNARAGRAARSYDFGSFNMQISDVIIAVASVIA